MPVPDRLKAPSKTTAPSRAPQWETVLEEDFAGFASGSEAEPAPVIEFENEYHIPETYTHQPGWTGQGVRPAGGCVALYPWETAYGDQRGGYISTPPADYPGTVEITLRARALGSETAGLWVALCDDYYGPGDDLEVEISGQWQTYTLQAQGSLEDPGYFQIMAETGNILVDDVKITFRRDRIASPAAHNAVNLSSTSFKASWEDTGAPTYRLNVSCLAPDPNGVSGSMFENFDGDSEGWTIRGTAENTDATFLSSGSKSLKLGELTDSLTSPRLPAAMTALSFWVCPSAYEDDDYNLSLLRVEILHENTGLWEPIAQIPYYFITQGGGAYPMSPYALGDDAVAVRFSIVQKGNVDFYIDDVAIEYASRGIRSEFIKDLDLTQTEYVVEAIDPRNEYTYWVQAIDDDLISAPSNEIWVDGVAGLKVQVNRPTDVADGAFTVSWQPLGHADSYSLTLSGITRAQEEIKDVTVIAENFDRIDQGTVEQPGSDWLSPFDFGAADWADNAWQATNPAWAMGMAGSFGTTWYGTAGLVFSPRLNLSANAGKGFDVEATVVTTTPAFTDAEGTEWAEGVFVMVLDSHTDYQAKAYALIETPRTGSTSARVHVPVEPGVSLDDVIVAFMSMSGQTFFVDDVRISQNLLPGEVLHSPLGTTATAQTSHRYENLTPGATYGVSVTASAEHNYENFLSQPSDLIEIKIEAAGIEEIPSTDAASEEIFTPGGRRVVGPLPAGLYITRSGKKLTVK